MEALYKLSDMICDELDEYARKGELSASSLDVVDKLSHALKSIKTIIAMEETSDGYSGTYNRHPYYRGSSYARGRKRDSMGRYSGSVDDMVGKLHDLMEEAPDESMREEIKRLVNKIEKM